MVHRDLNIPLETEPHAINPEEQTSWAAVGISAVDVLALTDVILIDPEKCIHCWFMNQYQEWQEKENPCIYSPFRYPSPEFSDSSFIGSNFHSGQTHYGFFPPPWKKNNPTYPPQKEPQNQNPPQQAQNKQTKLENLP